MGPQRFGAAVLGTLGAIAMLLTILGVYVLTESMALLRRREMGIRAALGAHGVQLAVLALRDSARVLGGGVLLGLLLSAVGARSIRMLLFQVQPLDAVSLIGAASLIVVFGALVTVRPAIAASRVDVVRVLKEE